MSGVDERLAKPYFIDLLPESPGQVAPADKASAESPEKAAQPTEPAWGPKTLTGDLFDELFLTRESVISFGGRGTLFGFGIAGGIDRPVPSPLGQGNDVSDTGQSEYDLLFDLEKFGGPKKGRVFVRAEHWYGEYGSVSLRAGTFAPPVFPALLPPRPNDPGVPYIMNFLWTQRLPQRWVIFAGKKDVLGSLDQDIFAGGDGTDQFVNQSFIANPAFLLGMPYRSFTAGFVSPPKMGRLRRVRLRPGEPDRRFHAGQRPVHDGYHRRRGNHIPVELFRNARSAPYRRHLEARRAKRSAVLVHPSSRALQNPGRFRSDSLELLHYGFDQYLVRFTQKPYRGCGLFGQAAITEGNPNQVRYFLSTGVGGFSPLGQRRGDNFNAGWFLVGASDQFGPVPTTIFGPRNGMGLELFYNFQSTPWLNTLPEIQWL